MNLFTKISRASIIPGLGLWLLGKRRDAVITATLFLSTVLIFFYSPWRSLASFSFVIGMFIWTIQITYTKHEIGLMQALKSGNLQQAKESVSIVSPSKLSRGEKLAFKAKEIVRQQVEINEDVLEAILAVQASSTYYVYYIGLLAGNFIFVYTDFLGKPAGVERVGFSSIQDLTVEYGLLTDTLIMFIDGKNPIPFKVNRGLRSHTEKFISMFKEKKSLLV